MVKTAILIVMAAIVGLSLTRAPDWSRNPDANAPRDILEDAWALRIRVDEARSGAAMPRQREYVGAVALLQTSIEGGRPWMTVSGFRYAGVFTDSFRAVGLSPSDGERAPLAAAKMLGGDSIEIVLNPTQDHGAMVLKGVINDTRVSGSWELTGYVPGARGTFEMTPLN